MKLHRLFLLALVAVCWLAVQRPVLANNPEQALLAEFPPLSIDSVERAEEAITRLPDVRKQLSDRYAQERADCLERFFVASCLSDLRTRERKAYKAINRIEVEAKALMRRERAAERDRAVAEREQRAAESGGKAIPFSGATRNKDRGEQGSSEGRESSKPRLQIERVPGPSEEADAQPVPAPATDVPEAATANGSDNHNHADSSDNAEVPAGRRAPALTGQEIAPASPDAVVPETLTPAEPSVRPEGEPHAAPEPSGGEQSPPLPPPAAVVPTEPVVPEPSAAPPADAADSRPDIGSAPDAGTPQDASRNTANP